MKTSVILFSILSYNHLLLYSQPNKLPIDASHSVISFSVGFAGNITSIEGRFNDFTGEIGYEKPGVPTSFFANVSINAESINTGDSQRDEDLKGEDFFNIAAYPRINFKSTSTSRTEKGFILNGNLDMLGITKQIAIEFQFTHKAPIVWVFGEPRIAARGSIKLKRSDFGIPKRGWNTMIPTLGSMVLNDEVEIRLIIQGVGSGLPEIIIREIETHNVKSGIKKYQEMLVENNGKQTYNFGARTLAEISVTLSRSGNNKDAIEIAEFATLEDPNNFFGYYALGIAYKAEGIKEQAIINFEKVLELNPKFEGAKLQLKALRSN